VTRAGTDVDLAVDRLDEAARLRSACPPVRHLLADVAEAYDVQRRLIARRVAGGATVVGRKIGLTSPAVQEQLGVDQPDFGVLLADMDVSTAWEVPIRLLLQPKVEAEVAFRLGADLVDGPFDLESVARAVDGAAAAIEIVDSRIANWDITITDTIADNGSSGLFAVSDTWSTLDAVNPRDVTMRMFAGIDDAEAELVSEGSGAACLGDPLAALAWLARTCGELGAPLRAGEIVLSGALGPMVAVSAGTVVRAELSMLGTISVRFAPAGQEC
jgi:2-keto-4-pentenoate hydratase